MKIRFILQLILALSVGVLNGYANSQDLSQTDELLPLLEDGKTWHCYGKNSLPPQYGLHYLEQTIYIQGDSILDGTRYKKAYIKTTYPLIGKEEEGVSLYKYAEGNAANAMGFDFDMNVGDLKINYENDDLTQGWLVKAVKDTILNDGIERKCLFLDFVWINKANNKTNIIDNDIWVEGIGSLKSGIYIDIPTESGGDRYALQSVSVGDNCIYKKQQKEKLEPVFENVCFNPQSPTTEDEVVFSVTLGIFIGNYSYRQQVDSIVGNTIYVGASYYGYDEKDIYPYHWPRETSLGKLPEGDYTVQYTVKVMPSKTEFIYSYNFSVTGANQIESINKGIQLQTEESAILCTSPTAVKLEIYTMDAVKVGEASFHNGEASVKVDKVPATNLYIVTYPDGRRESGKVVVR